MGENEFQTPLFAEYFNIFAIKTTEINVVYIDVTILAKYIQKGWSKPLICLLHWVHIFSRI